VWCGVTNECMSRQTTCLIPSTLVQYSQYCSSGTPPPVPVADTCANVRGCDSCVRQHNCGWCSYTSKCMLLTSQRYCPSSSFYSASCPRSASSRNVIAWVVLALGCIGTFIALTLVICIRRRRQAASEDVANFELQPTGGFSAPTTPSVLTSTVPGYMYTTASSGNQPQYIYTAVPVGPVLDSIPQ